MIGICAADISATRSVLMVVAESIAEKHPPAPTMSTMPPERSAASSMKPIMVLLGMYLLRTMPETITEMNSATFWFPMKETMV